MIEGTSVGFLPQGYVHIKQLRSTKNHVICIHGYHITPNFILIRCILHRYKISIIHLH